MNTTFISKEGNLVKFEMAFSAEEFEAAIVKAYKANKDQFQINGFRKGKAPRKMIERMYGEGIFWNDAIDELLTAYPAAIKELDLEVIDRPELDIPTIGKEGMVAVITVPVIPEVEVKGYKDIEVEKVAEDLLAVTEEEITAELEKVQKSQARMETIEDRPAENGDVTVIDFVGSVDGVEFEGGAGENYELTLGSGQFIPGFEEQLVGHNAEENVDVVVTFPEEYHAKDLAGKEAVFKCTIHEIKKEVLPEIDDELASDVSEFETLEEYKADIKAKVEAQKKAQAEDIMKNDMLKQIVEAQEVEAPATMVEDAIDNILNEMNQQMAMQGLSMEQYMQFTGQTLEQVRESYKPEGETRAKTRLVLRALVAAEGIEVTDEEVDAEIETMATMYGMPVDQVKQIVGENIKEIKEDVANKKVVEKLFAEVKLVDPKPVEAADAE